MPRLDWLSGRLHHGERLLWYGSQGHRWYWKPALGAALTLVSTVALGAVGAFGDILDVLSGEGTGFTLVAPFFIFLAATFAIGSICWRLFHRREQHFAITNHRILHFGTATGRELYELEACEIADYSVQKTSGGRGTIRIVTDLETLADRSIILSTAFDSKDQDNGRLDMIDIDNAAAAERALEIMLRESVSS